MLTPLRLIMPGDSSVEPVFEVSKSTTVDIQSVPTRDYGNLLHHIIVVRVHAGNLEVLVVVRGIQEVGCLISCAKELSGTCAIMD